MIPSGKIPAWLIPATAWLILAATCLVPYASAQQEVRFLFYNTENFFHPSDDSLKADDEFTPGGSRHWTYKRFNQKLLSISKVIISAGSPQPPGLIALCEVEDARVLRLLVNGPLLERFNYSIIHFDSPDERGIDVALIYSEAVFRVISARVIGIPVTNPEDPTRDILYVSGILCGVDTLHIFINHWPSRYAGAASTRPERQLAAQVLRYHIDSLLNTCRDPAVLVAGDMNDETADHSLSQVLQVRERGYGNRGKGLHSLPPQYAPGVYGTTKYQGFWYDFDHIFVSGRLLSPGPPTLEAEAMVVHSPGFLLEEDSRYGGLKPFRTYSGYTYQEGFSDHLPVYIDIITGPSGAVPGTGGNGPSRPKGPGGHLFF